MATNSDFQNIGIFLEDLLEKTTVDDTDLLMIVKHLQIIGYTHQLRCNL